MGAYRHIDLQPWVQVITQDLTDNTLGTQLAGGVIRYLRRDYLPRTRFTFGSRRNQYLVVNTAIVGNNKANAALFLVAADNAVVGPLHHLHNLTFRAAAAVQAGDRNQHLVAIEHKIHLPGIEVDIISFAQRDGKAVAVPVALHPTVQQVHFIHQAIGTATIDH